MLVNVAAILGCIVVGGLVDRLKLAKVVLDLCVGAAAAIFAVWEVSTSLVPLYVFALSYGLTAGSYSTAWTGMVKDIHRKSTTADANVVFGLLAAGRGRGATHFGSTE